MQFMPQSRLYFLLHLENWPQRVDRMGAPLLMVVYPRAAHYLRSRSARVLLKVMQLGVVRFQVNPLVALLITVAWLLLPVLTADPSGYRLHMHQRQGMAGYKVACLEPLPYLPIFPEADLSQVDRSAAPLIMAACQLLPMPKVDPLAHRLHSHQQPASVISEALHQVKRISSLTFQGAELCLRALVALVLLMEIKPLQVHLLVDLLACCLAMVAYLLLALSQRSKEGFSAVPSLMDAWRVPLVFPAYHKDKQLRLPRCRRAAPWEAARMGMQLAIFPTRSSLQSLI